MATPSGYIFSREAILENLLAQKKANKRKLAAWEAQQHNQLRKVCTQHTSHMTATSLYAMLVFIHGPPVSSAPVTPS